MRILFLTFALAAGLFAAKEVYTYDTAGRLTSVTYSDGTRVTYAYDKAGNITGSRVDRPSADPAAKARPRPTPPGRAPR